VCCVLCLRANTIVILTTTSSERTKVSFSYPSGRSARGDLFILSVHVYSFIYVVQFSFSFSHGLVSLVSYADFFATGVTIDS
jgi:hypothetical protein